MINFDKWRDKVIELANEEKCMIAISNGTPVRCTDITCDKCDYVSDIACHSSVYKWMFSEYKEPLIDWGKVEVDTPILVSNDGKNWHKRYFAKYKGGTGIIYAWRNGATSWSTDGLENNIFAWNYAKLKRDI